MKFLELSDEILRELASILHQVAGRSARELVEAILSSDRIFIAGAGRSGLVARPFAMRLMQMGFPVHIVGEPTTPAIEESDLLIAISSSGETETTHHIASTAKSLGASIFLLTSQPSSRIRDISDLTLILPNVSQPVLPLGSAFEGAVYILLDAVAILIMEETSVTQQEMMKRHSNLE